MRCISAECWQSRLRAASRGALALLAFGVAPAAWAAGPVGPRARLPVERVAASAPAASAPSSAPSTESPRSAVDELQRRKDILDRIRCEGADPATCFIDSEGAAGAPGQPLAEAVTEEEVDALLEHILDGLQAHEAEAVRAAEQELSDEAFQELAWFGSADYFMHPATDIYKNPRKALAERPELHLDQINPADFDYPLVVNERVKNWMAYFLTRGRKYYTRWLARSERYLPLIIPRLEEAGLPKDLAFQAMIESGFNPYARSWAKAVGVWQFMPYTGRAYGLRVDWWVDERRDPVLATEAAIRYLSSLHTRFGSWELASASYNAGEGKIGRAIKRYGTRDYWELSSAQRTYLKSETKHYVPKIIAAAILYKYRDRYFSADEIKDEDRLGVWDFDIVHVPEATDLGVIAKAAGVDEKQLVADNPQLRRWCTPPGIENYPIRLARGTGETFAEAFAKIPPEERVTFERYRIRRGDTLGRIAQRYGISLASIEKMNKGLNLRRLRVGKYLVIPVRAASAVGGRELLHEVARGESLGAIAGKYGTSVSQIKTLNSLSSDVIHPGQRLKVHGTAPAVASKSRSKSSGGKARVSYATYKVRKGDVLGKVASRYSMSLAELRKVNGLKSDTIYVGQRLKVRGGSGSGGSRSSRPSSHTVASGDSLWSIARKYGVSVGDLQRWNSLSGSSIRSGQKLKLAGGSKRVASASTYKVRSGDTLWAIARRNGVSVADLKKWNRLRSNTVKVGQRLTVKR